MIKILLAEKSRLIREGIKLVLCSDEQISITGIASSKEEILQNIKDNSYDILVANLNTPEGIWEIFPQIKEANENIRIVVFSENTAPIFNTFVYKSGADAFLSVDLSGDEIIDIIKKVHSNNYTPTPSRVHKLSSRQIHILWQIVSGYSINEIAEKMSLSIKTVNTHKIRAYAKLGIKNNLEAVQLFGKKTPEIDFKKIAEF